MLNLWYLGGIIGENNNSKTIAHISPYHLLES
jgi:hypothetical protein